MRACVSAKERGSRSFLFRSCGICEDGGPQSDPPLASSSDSLGQMPSSPPLGDTVHSALVGHLSQDSFSVSTEMTQAREGREGFLFDYTDGGAPIQNLTRDVILKK